MDLLQRVRARVTARRRRPALPVRGWFDEPDALDQIDRRAASAADRELLRSWVTDGSVLVEGLVPATLLDALQSEVAGLFVREQPVDGLGFFDLVFDDGHRPFTTHAELLARPVEERLRARGASPWRINGFHQHSHVADQIRRYPELRRVAALLLGVESEAPYSINFHNGSMQALHEDSAVFHLAVPNLICGAWIACEDVSPEAGPLVYYPGSHRRSMFPGFDAYPLTNLRTADPATAAAYNAHVVQEAFAFERRQMLARRGDVFFWHGMLIHGGDEIRDAACTRRSYVVHFVPDGADAADRVDLPANW